MTLTEILSAKKKDELTALAKALKITKYSAMKKAELVAALENAINADTAGATGDAEIIALFGSDDTLHMYALAATHFYGSIKLSAFLNLLARFEGREFDAAEVKDALSPKESVLPYLFIGDQLANAIFMQDPDSLPQLLSEAADVIRYVPETKDEFLKYASEEYFEENLQYKNLWAVLSDAVGSIDTAKHLTAEARKLFAMGSSLQDCVMVLQACGVAPNDEAPVWKLNMMIQNAFNASRMWKHRGHTESEMAKMPKADRNEKCPCGSGIKYKKCCFGR